MHRLAQQLIDAERGAGQEADHGSRAAFRVCEKLRRPLSTFAGLAGFRSLVSRALALAKVEAPLLNGFQIAKDGTFDYTPELSEQLNSAEAARAAALLVNEVIELLVTFIGEALTLRLVHDVWPNAAAESSKSPGK